MTNQSLTVQMTTEIADSINYSLSPMDGLAALTLIYEHLPRLHRNRRAAHCLPFGRKSMRIHHGLIEWADIGFTYVEWRSVLHVLECWSQAYRNLSSFDVVFSKDLRVDLGDATASDRGTCTVSQ
jgi:hypothetical protein